MRQYQLALLARQDLADIYSYIANDNVSAARRLIEALHAAFRMLADAPELGTLCPEYRLKSVRTFSVRSYVVFYKHLDGGIEVFRVLHGARDIDSLLS